jgi:hypothetical protein
MDPDNRSDGFDDGPEMSEEWDAVLLREVELNTRNSPTHSLTEDLHINACAVSILMKEKLAETFPPTSEGLELEALFPEAASFWGRRCLSAYLRNDWEFFDSLQKATATWGNRRAKKKDYVQQSEVIRIAVELFYRLERNPTFDELKAETEKAGIVVGAWNKTITDCCLTFLEGAIRKPGRPKD